MGAPCRRARRTTGVRSAGRGAVLVCRMAALGSARRGRSRQAPDLGAGVGHRPAGRRPAATADGRAVDRDVAVGTDGTRAVALRAGRQRDVEHRPRDGRRRRDDLGPASGEETNSGSALKSFTTAAPHCCAGSSQCRTSGRTSACRKWSSPSHHGQGSVSSTSKYQRQNARQSPRSAFTRPPQQPAGSRTPPTPQRGPRASSDPDPAACQSTGRASARCSRAAARSP